MRQIEKLRRYFSHLIRAQLTVTQEGYRYEAELRVVVADREAASIIAPKDRTGASAIAVAPAGAALDAGVASIVDRVRSVLFFILCCSVGSSRWLAAPWRLTGYGTAWVVIGIRGAQKEAWHGLEAAGQSPRIPAKAVTAGRCLLMQLNVNDNVSHSCFEVVFVYLVHNRTFQVVFLWLSRQKRGTEDGKARPPAWASSIE